jgi:predicted DNA binding CopG/RHH family protein
MSEIQKFKTETEEAEWWKTHEDELANALMKAEAADDLSSGLLTTAADLAIHIRPDPEDIAQARVQAAERGLRYQTYLKMIIHEALRKAENSRSASTS